MADSLDKKNSQQYSFSKKSFHSKKSFNSESYSGPDLEN